MSFLNLFCHPQKSNPASRIPVFMVDIAMNWMMERFSALVMKQATKEIFVISVL